MTNAKYSYLLCAESKLVTTTNKKQRVTDGFGLPVVKLIMKIMCLRVKQNSVVCKFNVTCIFSMANCHKTKEKYFLFLAKKKS